MTIPRVNQPQTLEAVPEAMRRKMSAATRGHNSLDSSRHPRRDTPNAPLYAIRHNSACWPCHCSFKPRCSSCYGCIYGPNWNICPDLNAAGVDVDHG